MATWAYPPLPPERLEQEVDSALAKELEWLLRSLQDSLASLREGLHECAALLAPKEPGSTLVLSSLRSENVKGFVTRVGTKIVKGDIQLRLSSLASRGSATTRLCLANTPTTPELILSQLVSVRNLVNQSLDIVDVSTWTGDPLNAGFIYSQLHLLRETISEARQMLKGESEKVRGKWWETSAQEEMFDPPLPAYLSFHLSIADSALVLYLRTLESNTPIHTPTAFATDISLTGFNLRDRLFGSRHRPHDEAGDVFTWKGDEVKVKEKIRVESQDPSLMAVMAKLTALEHEVMKWISALKVLMGNEDTDSESHISSRGRVEDVVTISGSQGDPIPSPWPFTSGRIQVAADRTSIARKASPSTLHLESLLREATYARSQPWLHGQRHSSSTTPTETDPDAEKKDTIYALVDKINETDLEMAELMHELDLLDDHEKALNPEGLDFDYALSQTIGHRDEETLDARVRQARQEFGEYLPEGLLNDRETQLYTRLYGEPVYLSQESELDLVEEGEEIDPDRLYREDGEGGWEEVEMDASEAHDEPPLVYDMEAPPSIEETIAMQRTREVAEQLGGEIMLEQFEDEAAADSAPKFHPLTTIGKFSTDPSTIFIPKDSVTGPISVILSDFSNKHIADTAHRTLGGQYLPYSTTTPPLRLQAPQQPIPLEASQRYMSEMEANVFLAALYPGMYASVLSVLVEVRKRLGTDWIRNLMTQEGGPHVLDVSAGGAGVLAWRDILRAEWEAMTPEQRPEDPYPVGRSTVVTGSDTLRLRASAMLEDTSFLPRLPDYVHVREKPTLQDERAPPKRKQYDIIIAPHSLLGIEEEFLRKEHVQNLWNLLNPNGGVLILLEKGHQKGFEAVAGARDMLLKRFISSPGSTRYENLTDSPEEETFIEKEAGMIVAPCTNHNKCPMYQIPGHAKGRRDYCHFQQRYIRPAFLQRIIGAKDRNHEDLKFSYIAVQRGVDRRVEDNIIQGTEAADAAFDGYEDAVEMPKQEAETSLDEAVASETQPTPTTEQQETGGVNFLSLPRIVYQPMKRRGHVIFDLCTPAGKIERWTVPRSFSRQAYKDARKSQWGDLWALGAKTRVARSLRLGDKHGEGRKERLARRAAEKQEMEEEGEDALEEGMEATSIMPDIQTPLKKKGQKIPSWEKQQLKKKRRQALKQVRPSA
ncbi:37S ribosomal protein S22 [Aspergillus brasiliensis]|uniref:37S ribosomal protein S22 n=1 Tax=Aspergillus brasiliensis TaxID=319629 RepID=A0A9W5Z1R4_9EURO|nr:37S ribosomal protein S22 [Aspergillus brasiliensis]GKZ49411.1 37S ribosomal protein S22 [Aspergillus brasiliensis]